MKKVPYADSRDIPGYYGILNEHGDFWSHTVHSSRRAAETYIRNFWGQQTDMAETCLRGFQIIEVRVTLKPRAASGIETEGHDREAGHGAEHESPVAATSGETPNA